jgi:hypothetical protein
MRSATYLSIDALYDKIQARIVQEYMHGLFHAFLEFISTSVFTGGSGGLGGWGMQAPAVRSTHTPDPRVRHQRGREELAPGARGALSPGGLIRRGVVHDQIRHPPAENTRLTSQGPLEAHDPVQHIRADLRGVARDGQAQQGDRRVS